ncbi:DUF2064 domain-containing protein [Pseudomonas sp. sp1636]|uniref:TIGR04282 family arsenosugar biosynthesis glycosyltransferase n=1 Tax=Pseudomonas sp. sp1636 TaxID=3036707 RepID=UPI0025A56D95|nr:DUF2064 domain-containing protein [Pseudomonas sp. sp1636]MDM8349481.1 DUF2064 domain-containing protein [Pseudomonas sp. sp1636]
MTDSTAAEAPTAIAPCLVLLCKRPALGHSKQRLAQQIGLQPALDIAQLLLACALEDLHQWPAPKVIAPDHSRHLPWAQALCPQALGMAQHDGNLGQRLNDLDSRLHALDLQRLIYIGSDCPVLQPSDYQRVTCLLEANDTVLLAAKDGGVVLMASNRSWPDLSALPWSTEHLGSALFDCCQRAGHSVAWAGELFDIDHKEDLYALPSLLEQHGQPARLNLHHALQQLGVPAHAC